MLIDPCATGDIRQEGNKGALGSERTHCSDGSWHATLLVTLEEPVLGIPGLVPSESQKKMVMVHQPLPPTHLFGVLKQNDPVACIGKVSFCLRALETCRHQQVTQYPTIGKLAMLCGYEAWYSQSFGWNGVLSWDTEPGFLGLSDFFLLEHLNPQVLCTTGLF